jgi:hypothetical protein
VQAGSLASVALLSLLSIAGCGTQDRADELRRIAANSDSPVYWLGEQFRGLPLTYVASVGRGEIELAYGTCATSWDQGCTAPIALTQMPLSRRHPSMFDSHIWCRRYRLRGVPAAFVGGFDIYTGNSTVTIYAHKGLTFPAAHGLRPLGGGQGSGGGRLPPPAASVNRELRRCPAG